MLDELRRTFHSIVLPIAVFAVCDGLLAFHYPAMDAFLVCTGVLGGGGLLLSIAMWRRRGATSTGPYPYAAGVCGQAALAASLASAAILVLIRWALLEASGLPVADEGPPWWVLVAILLAADAIVTARAFGTHWAVSGLVPIAHAGILLCVFQFLVAYPFWMGAGGMVLSLTCRGALRPAMRASAPQTP